MKRFLFLLMVGVYFIGCGQPQVVKREYKKIKVENYKNLSPREAENVYQDVLKNLSKNKVLQNHYREFVYSKDDIKVKFNKYMGVNIIYYDEVTPQKVKEAEKIVNLVTTKINSILKKESQVKSKVAKILKTSPQKFIVIGNRELTEDEKKVLLEKFVKYININVKGEKVCLSWYGRSFKFGPLYFEIERKSCQWFNYWSLNNTKYLRREMFLDVYFLPQYDVSFEKVNLNIVSNFKYDTNYKKRLNFRVRFENKSGDYKKFDYLTFYYLENSFNFTTRQVIAPFTTIAKDFLTTLPKYRCEVTKENKHNLRYGIAFKLDSKTFSLIKSEDFDKLFKKYVK